MEPVGIRQIINQYRQEHLKYILYTDEAILRLISEKKSELLKGISQAEIDEVMKGSVFSVGFNPLNNMGLEIEHTGKDKPTENKKKALEIIRQKSPKGNVYRTTFQALQELGMDIDSPDGAKIMEGISKLPSEIYMEENIGETLIETMTKYDLSPDFKNVANVMESMGISIRTDEEEEAEKEEIKKLNARLFAQSLLVCMNSKASEMYDDAHNNIHGSFTKFLDFGFYADNFNKLTKSDTKSLSKHYAKWANNYEDMNPYDEESFKTKLKQYMGIDLDEEAVLKNIEILQNPQSKEFKKVYKEIFGYNALKDANTNLTVTNLANGFGDAGIMLMTLGYAGEVKALQAGKILAAETSAAMGSKLAAKAATKSTKFGRMMTKLAARGAKLLGPSVAGGFELGGFELAKGTLGNITTAKSGNEFVHNEAMAINRSISSFGFGFFGGIWGQTAVAKTMGAVSRTSARTTAELAPKFAKGSVDLSEVVATYIEKSAPTASAKIAGFVTEIAGFTMYETAISVLENIPNFPDGMSVEDVANILWEQFKGQGIGLGQIKLISALIMWGRGGRTAQKTSMDYLAKSKEFEGIKVNPITENGKTRYVIEGKKLSLECKDLNEVITSGLFIVQMDKAFDELAETKPETKVKTEETKPEQKVETEVKPENTKAEKEIRSAEIKPEQNVEGKTQETIINSWSELENLKYDELKAKFRQYCASNELTLREKVLDYYENSDYIFTDSKGREVRKVHVTSSGKVTSDIYYDYDAAGNKIGERQYDSKGKLVNKPATETKATAEAKPEESMSAGNRTNDKISPKLMAEFEHYAKENNLKLTISKHGNVVFRDNDGKIARRVDIDENGNVREDKVFNEPAFEPIIGPEDKYIRKYSIKNLDEELSSNDNNFNMPDYDYLDNPEDVPRQFDDALSMIKDEKFRNIFENNITLTKLIKSNAPRFMINMQRHSLISKINKYIELRELIDKIKDENVRKSLLSDLYKAYSCENLMASGQILDNIKRFLNGEENSRYSDGVMKYLEKANPEFASELSKDYNDIKDPNIRDVKLDLEKHNKYEKTIALCSTSPKSEAARTEYGKYLDEELSSLNPTTANQLKKLCHNIEKEFDTRVFLPSNLKEAGVALKLIYSELTNYKSLAKKAGEEAIIPPVINCLRTNIGFLNGNAQAEYLQGTNAVLEDGLTIQLIKSSLRHELMHANDHYSTPYFPEGFDPTMFIDDLLSAGLRPGQIKVALENRFEFLAYAAEGHMPNYDESFKEILVKLGMPKWATNMSNYDANQKVLPRSKWFNVNMLLTDMYYKEHSDMRSRISEDISDDAPIDYNINYNELGEDTYFPPKYSINPEAESSDFGTTPQIVTTEEFAKHVGVNNKNNLYRIKGLIINKGKIDLSIPANRELYDNYQSRKRNISTETYPKQEAPANLTPTGKAKRGRKSKSTEAPKNMPGTQGTANNKTPVIKELSKADYAETLGLSENTIDLFIEKGNIVVNKDGKINWNNPQNKEFTRFAMNLIMQLAAPKPEANNKQTENKASEQTSPKFVSIAEFADMIGIRASNVYTLKDLITTKDPKTNHKMIDITLESNKEIIRRYQIKDYAETLGLSENTVNLFIEQGKIIVNEEGMIDRNNPVNKGFTLYAIELVGKIFAHKPNANNVNTADSNHIYIKNCKGKSPQDILLELGFKDADIILELFPEKAKKFLQALEILDLGIDKSKINEKTSTDIFYNDEILDILVSPKNNEVKIENLQQLFDRAKMIDKLNMVKQQVNKLLGGRTSSLIDNKPYNESTFIYIDKDKVYTILDITGKDIITTRDLKVFSTCPVEKCKKLGISKIDTEDGLRIVMEEGKDMDLTSIQRIWDALYNNRKSLPVSIDDKNPKYPISEINFTSNSITITMRDGNKMDIPTFMALYKHCFKENSISSLQESSVVSVFTNNLDDILENEFSRAPWNKTEKPANLWNELPKMRKMWLHPKNQKYRDELPNLLTDKMWNNTCFKTYRSRLRFLENVILKDNLEWDDKHSKIWGYYLRKLADHEKIADKIKLFDAKVKEKLSSEKLHIEKEPDKNGIPCIKFIFDDKVYGVGIGECNTDEGFFIETVYKTKKFPF